MKGEEQDVKNATEAVGEALEDSLPVKIAEMTKSFMETGQMPKEALGFSDEKMEAMYGQAYRLYNTGKYQDALNFFRLLIVLNSTEPRYTLGFAACFHMMKEYENAAKAYMVASIMDAKNPIPCFHASDCYIKMEDPATAIIYLELAVEKAGEKPEFQVLKDRALLSIESLKKELGVIEK